LHGTFPPDVRWRQLSRGCGRRDTIL
jgi:hypothetical protein